MSRETDLNAIMPLRVAVSHEDSAATLTLSGEFDLASIKEAQSGLEEALATGAKEITVDLRGLTFIDSTGIAFLLTIHGRDGAAAFRFLASEAPAVRRILAVTGVDRALGGVDSPST